MRQAWASVLRVFRRLPKTQSEILFEVYLRAAGLTWTYEEEVQGSSRRPDYGLVLAGEPARFEVKQFQQEPGDILGGAYDPYPPVRQKINEAAGQLRALKGKAACCVVLYNFDKPLVHLSPLAIYSAMLGDVGWEFPFYVESGQGDFEMGRMAFGKRGKMVRYGKDGKPVAPQNTTISAVVALTWLPHGERRFWIDARQEQKRLGHDLSMEELIDRMEAAQGTDRDVSAKALRVVVCENPYAVKPLSRTFGRGPFDERYGADDAGRLTRIFAGLEIHKLEDAERALGEPVHIWQWH